MDDDYQLHREIMLIEGQRWRYEAVKLDTVRKQTGLSPTRYYQLVAAIVASPSVEIAGEFGPTINRLRRLMERKLQLIRPRVA